MEMMKILAREFFDRGEYRMARNVYIQLMNMDDPSPAGYFTTATFFAKCSFRCGFNNEALTIFKSVLEGTRGRVDEGSDFILEVKNELGNCLLAEGKYEEALQCFQEIQAEDDKKGVEDKDTLVTKTNVALCLTNLNRYDEAYKIYQENLKKQIELNGADHPHIKTTKNNIAALLHRMGRTEESFKMLQETEGGASSASSEDTDLQLKVNKVSTLISLGKHKEALELCFEAQKLIKRKYHDKHPLLLSNQLSMIQVLSALEMHDEAMQIAMDSMKLHKEVYDLKNPKMIDAFDILAHCYSNLKNYEEALKIQREAENLFKDTIDVRGLATLRNNIAKTLFKLERPDEALNVINAAVIDMERILGEDHKNVRFIKANKAELLCQCGKFAEAAKLLREVELKAKQATDLESCTQIRIKLLLCYVNLDDLNQALEIYSNLVGKEYDDHELTKTKNDLANKLADKEMHAQALRVFKEVEKIMQSVGLPPHNGALLNTKLNIGAMLKALGKNDEAKSYFSYVSSVERQSKK